MKPRIFVSSTFYDLKYIREDLSEFIKTHDFEPIMFEDGDIGYIPGKPLDYSCYETMRSADMVILIIGGNYGSTATGESSNSFEDYMSVTRREFRSAVENAVPIYAFIESNVYAEFGVYDINAREIESGSIELKFKATKSINVFRFIKEIMNVGDISIIDFKRSAEIKSFLSKQWADIFKNYLKGLKEERNDVKLYSSIDNLRQLIEKMDIMVEGLGKKVIGAESDITYENIAHAQMEAKVLNYAKKVCAEFSITTFITDSLGNRKLIIESFISKLEKLCYKDLQYLDHRDASASIIDTFNDSDTDYKFDGFNGNLRLFTEILFIFQDQNFKERFTEELSLDSNYSNLVDGQVLSND